MSYAAIFDRAQIIQTTGDIVVPSTYKGEKNFIIPDQIVNFCISKYNLSNNNLSILDPMCGIGTIPRLINKHGGNCIGIEIDKNRFEVASEVLDNSKLFLGDCLTISLEEKFHCIFTSIPFDWFKNDISQINSNYAEKFKKILTQDGFVLLDSIPFVTREGSKWPVASKQCAYLEANGFVLTEVIRFKNDINIDDTDESVVMKFLLA